MKFPPATDIHKIRTAMDVTQTELASKSGVSQSTIAKIERGRISASYETVVRLFETLEKMRVEIGDGKKASDVCSRDIYSVQDTDLLTIASDMMRVTGFSQLPVFSGETPVGSISEWDVMEMMAHGMTTQQLSTVLVKEVMGDSFPVVSHTTPVSSVAMLMADSNAVLVSMQGKIVGMITKADMLKLI